MLKRSLVGPLSRIYVGPGPMSDEDLEDNVLKRIIATRTKGGFLTVEQPKQFVAVRRSYLPSGAAVLNFNLTFQDALEDVIKLAKGIQISDDTNINDPAGSATYTMLLIGPHPNLLTRNYLIHACQTVSPITDNFEKLSPYNQPITFSYQEVDPNLPMYSQGTAAELAALLAGRSPI